MKKTNGHIDSADKQRCPGTPILLGLASPWIKSIKQMRPERPSMPPLQMRSIILPVDFSSASSAAVQRVKAIAKYSSSTVTLVHVIEPVAILPLTISVPGTDGMLSAYTAKQQERLEAFGLNELGGVPEKRVVCSGEPAKKIVEWADREDADLILMPTHGYGPVRLFLLGSVTAAVLDEAKCPVWTGVHVADETTPGILHMREVICGFNFDPQSIRALQWASAFANKLGASLTAIYAFPGTPPSNYPERYAAEWEQDAPSGIESRIRGFARDSDIEAEIFVIEGDAPSVLADAAKTRQAGLLVIGRSWPRVATRRLGPDAYNIIRHAPCPVVSV